MIDPAETRTLHCPIHGKVEDDHDVDYCLEVNTGD
jgi:hypothetical protein